MQHTFSALLFIAFRISGVCVAYVGLFELRLACFSSWLPILLACMLEGVVTDGGCGCGGSGGGGGTDVSDTTSFPAV